MLVVGHDEAVVAQLEERQCTVLRAGSVADAAAGRASDGPFDAVVLADEFATLADPAEALREVSKLVADDGQVLVVAANATHASNRVQALRGAVAGRQYDLAALEAVLADAGLHVSERLRVIAPVPAAELDAVVPGLAEVMTGADAETSAYVLVAGRGERAAASQGETVAEALQRNVASLTAQLADLEQTRAALGAAEEKIVDQAAELDAREAALVERIELIERLYAERRHLELEIVVKDDYISILRRDRNEWRNIHAALQNDMDELKRSRHYKVAVGMHAAIQRVPLLHRVARLVARGLMAARGRGA